LIVPADGFVFKPPREIAFAQRILIKPNARCAERHPATTSRDTLAAVIAGIRNVSGADIVLLERSSGPDTMRSIYRQLKYDFPHTMLLDVDQCVPVAVENPLSKPFAISTFWVPNVILSCDYLISIAPLKVVAGSGDFSIGNLLGLLPAAKYRRQLKALDGFGRGPDVESIAADLHFTLPFDMGIIDGRKRLTSDEDPFHGDVQEDGRVFVGAPYQVDCEASSELGVKAEHLRLIEKAKDDQRRSSNDGGEQR
jgi:uncharacterized protein (DUF362 family)